MKDNKLMMNPFVVPCKKHNNKFHLDCKACVKLIKESMFKKEGEWNYVKSYDEVVDFMKKKGLAVDK